MSVSSLLLVTVTSEVTRIGRAKCIAMVGARDQFPIPLHYIISTCVVYENTTTPIHFALNAARIV